MSVQDFVDVIVTFVKTHESWAIPIAFLVAFAESFCFFSIIWPGTAILIAITALLAASGADQGLVVPAIIAAGLGGTLGYAVSYWIGLYFKDSIPNIWPFKNRPELIQHGENFFARWGGWGVFVGHFFGPVRAVIPVVAGMFRMRQLPFQIANAASAFIWAAGVIAPSFFAVTFRDDIVAFVREHQLLIAGLLFLLAAMNAIPMPLFAIPTLLIFFLLALAFIYAGASPLLAIVASIAGAFAGDAIAYVQGRRHYGELHEVWPNSWSPESGDEAIAFMRKRGLAGLVFSKFHTTLRSFAPLAAGSLALPRGSFLAASLVSCVIWTAVLLAPIFVLRHYFPI
jgi:membrane protein DedA with SNARE-associated domain